jgi:xylan 1,4-beta-xylosidase
MGLRDQLRAIDGGLRVIASFPEFKDRPVILGESDPEGLAALPSSRAPQNGYRNGALYGAYVAAAIASTYELSLRHGVRIEAR